MFQGLRFTEFAIVHGIDLRTLGELLGFMTVSFLPAILPMSLLFSVLMTYSRFSGDSEIVAFKSCGLNMTKIAAPALMLSLLTAIASAQTSFNLAPWGNRQFEVLLTQIAETKAGLTIKEGTFLEGFFNLVVYANKANSESGEVEKVFIYDERQEPPLTIIAKKGLIKNTKTLEQNQLQLDLFDGDIHRKTETHTKIKFGEYNIQLNENLQVATKDKSLQSLTLEELHSQIKDPNTPGPERTKYQSEYHKRWSIAAACILFTLLGVGLGSTTNKRSGKGSGLVICIIIIVAYWILFIAAESSARTGKVPVALALWVPNFIVGLFAAQSLRKSWN